MYVRYNPNPRGASRAGDCVVRALTIATGRTWEEVYIELSIIGFKMGDMPSSNNVWAQFLIDCGFNVGSLPDTCPRCYTVNDFTIDYPRGTYVLGTGTHVVTVINGDYYDSWDSGDEIPLYFFRKG